MSVSRRGFLSAAGAAVGVGLVTALPATAADSFVLGSTLPTASNTGVTAGTTLSVFNGDYIVTQAGAVVQNLEIRGFLRVRAANVTVRNCRIVSRNVGYVINGLVDATDARCTNLRVEFCEITPVANGVDNSRYWLNGVVGTNFSLYRCNIWGINDGVFPSGGAWSVQGCYFHDFRFGTDDADHAKDTRYPNWSHNDGVQVNAATSFDITGCRFDMSFHPTAGSGAAAAGSALYPNAHGILLGPRKGTFSGSVTQCWFRAGEDPILGTQQNAGFDTGNSVTFSGNRIVPNQCVTYGGHHVQIVLVPSMGSFTGMDSTIYTDDPSTPADLRGKPIQPAVMSGNTLFYRLD